MWKKIRMVILSTVLATVMCSQTFAVTYEPNRNENITIENVSLLEEPTYTEEDVEKVLNFYSTQKGITVEEYDKYDLNGDGYINSVDASMIRDRMN